eukprot:CAMPEP_0171141084 /NCGR_PEP_ID=MMETSP0766_2-20121228/140036_1 /TAXON_ID=439317 /ORGANISM="Gambierdiscus australes, Strain CAWD 149" /LENGTH=82 /DNA_ID=CAMNT_0011604803 /DNA_START=42 /DNA_END=286 /DNA_ORIENTATION=+
MRIETAAEGGRDHLRGVEVEQPIQHVRPISRRVRGKEGEVRRPHLAENRYSHGLLQVTKELLLHVRGSVQADPIDVIGPDHV